MVVMCKKEMGFFVATQDGRFFPRGEAGGPSKGHPSLTKGVINELPASGVSI